MGNLLAGEVIFQWNTKREELKKKGLVDREIVKLVPSRRKNRLGNTENHGGPFHILNAG